VSVRLHPDPDAESLFAYGDAINNTGETQEIGRIVATFYDDQGQTIGFPNDTNDYVPIDIVPPGGRVPFELSTDEIGNAASYLIVVESDPNSETPRIDGFQFQVQSQFIDDFEDYCLTATVKNTGAELTEYLSIVAELYTGDDKLIGFSLPYEPSLEEIANGLEHQFDICIDPLGIDLTGARHELRAFGR
jgi:hypothetical protein